MGSPAAASAQRRGAIAVAILSFASALPCLAQEVVYGPDGAPTVVQHKKHRLSGRFETRLLASRGLNDALADHTGLSLEGAFHPNESLDLGAVVLLNSTGLSSLVGQIRDRLPPRTVGSAGVIGGELGGASQLRAGALAQARLAPIYGKLNFAGELAVHFQAFALVGAGVARVRHESVNLCADAGPSPCGPDRYQTASSLEPLGEAGLGLRFFLGRRASLETQLRFYFHPDRVKENADLSDPASGRSRRVLAVLPALLAGLSVMY